MLELNSERTNIWKKNILLSLSFLLNSAKFTSFCSYEGIILLSCRLLFASPGWHHCLHYCEVCPNITFMWHLCRVEDVLPRAFLKHGLYQFLNFSTSQNLTSGSKFGLALIAVFHNETFWPIRYSDHVLQHLSDVVRYWNVGDQWRTTLITAGW